MRKIDGQLTNMAGEFFTMGKLFKRGYQASITLGNAKAIDILVYNPKNNKNYNIQVKALRKKNYFPMKKEDVYKDFIYIFVILNEFDEKEEYYIIPGKEILSDINKYFGSSYRKEKPSPFPGIDHNAVRSYKDNWNIFDT